MRPTLSKCRKPVLVTDAASMAIFNTANLDVNDRGSLQRYELHLRLMPIVGDADPREPGHPLHAAATGVPALAGQPAPHPDIGQVYWPGAGGGGGGGGGSVSDGSDDSVVEVNASVVGVVKSLSGHVHSHAVEGEIPTAQIFAQRGAPIHLFWSSPVSVERFCAQRGDLKMSIVSFDRDRAKIHACGDGAVAKKGE